MEQLNWVGKTDGGLRAIRDDNSSEAEAGPLPQPILISLNVRLYGRTSCLICDRGAAQSLWGVCGRLYLLDGLRNLGGQHEQKIS